ncbi:Papain family cysteine protease [Lachnospiraceae bacterium]|nr:Papain family cysteine protease [Lachnospiraceae bacterium]
MNKKVFMKVAAVVLTVALGASNVAAEPAPEEDITVSEAEVNEEPVLASDSIENQQIFMTGARTIPEDLITEMTDEDISFAEIKRRKVEDNDSETSSYIPRADLPERYPGETNDETQEFLSSKYPGARNQNPFGSCWAFSMIGNAEFNRISHGKADKSIDLSELYLAYGLYTEQENPIVGNDDAVSSVTTVSGNDLNKLNEGGYARTSAQYLSKGYGYIPENKLEYIYDESDDRFDEAGNLDIDIASLKKEAVLQMADYYEPDIKNENGMNIIKEAIMQNGLVGVSFYALTYSNNPYYNNTNNAYYCYNDQTGTNHAVAIVGWDDNFSTANFDAAHRPDNNGAWLIRNSWGEENDPFFSYYKYFWISYEDKSIDAANIIDLAESVNYDNNYYYDSQAHYWYSLLDGSSVANVYKVQDKGNEKLTEINIEIDLAADYEIKIYRNLKDISDPESGILVSDATTKGSLSLPGVYNIPLNKPVLLQKGSSFSIVVKTSKGSVCFEYTLPSTFNDGSGFTIECGLKKNQSFIMKDSDWKDWYDVCADDEYVGFRDGIGNFCIAAHTVNTTENEIEEKFKDPSGKEVTLLYNTDYGTYKTEDGKDVLVFSKENGEKIPTPKYQFTGKKVCPSKKAYVVYNGILYTFKTDYSIGFKKNKKRGNSEATIKWKKKSDPYKAGTKKSTMKFEIVERTVTDDMVSFKVKKGKLKNLRVKADGIEMKPKKDDYSYTGSSTEGFKITFKNNYKGTVTKKG